MANEEAKGRRAVQFVCGTPAEFCNGRSCMDHNSGDKYGKFHSDQAGAKSCMANYLIKQGYQKVGANTWNLGEDQPYLVVSKRCARLKAGKIKGGYMSRPLKVRDCLPLPKG